MKYNFELTLVVRTETDGHDGIIWEAQSIDVVQDKNLIGLLAQFQLILANVHRRIVGDVKREFKIVDINDDIPF